MCASCVLSVPLSVSVSVCCHRCGDISCGKLTCQQFMNKGIDPVKDMGCDACDECLECNFWNCAQRDTAIAY